MGENLRQSVHQCSVELGEYNLICWMEEEDLQKFVIDHKHDERHQSVKEMRGGVQELNKHPSWVYQCTAKALESAVYKSFSRDAFQNKDANIISNIFQNKDANISK